MSNHDDAESLARRVELRDAVRLCARQYLSRLKPSAPKDLKQALHDIERGVGTRYSVAFALRFLEAEEHSQGGHFCFADAMRAETVKRLGPPPTTPEFTYLDLLASRAFSEPVQARFLVERTIPIHEPALRFSQHELHKLEAYIDALSAWKPGQET